MAKKKVVIPLEKLEAAIAQASDEIQKCREMIEWYEDRNDYHQASNYRIILSRILVDVSSAQKLYDEMKARKK